MYVCIVCMYVHRETEYGFDEVTLHSLDLINCSAFLITVTTACNVKKPYVPVTKLILIKTFKRHIEI